MSFNPAMGDTLDHSVELAEERLRLAKETFRKAQRDIREAAEEVRVLRMRRTRYEWWLNDKREPYEEAWGE